MIWEYPYFWKHPFGGLIAENCVFCYKWESVEIMWRTHPISWCHRTSVYFSIMVPGVPTITCNINRISTQMMDWSGEKSPQIDNLHTDFSKHFIAFFWGMIIIHHSRYWNPCSCSFQYISRSGRIPLPTWMIDLHQSVTMVLATLQIHSWFWCCHHPCFDHHLKGVLSQHSFLETTKKEACSRCLSRVYLISSDFLEMWLFISSNRQRTQKNIACGKYNGQFCMSQWLLLKVGEKTHNSFPNKKSISCT